MLERGDTSQGAIATFDRWGSGFRRPGGGAELQLLAGRLLRTRGDTARAERLFRSAVASKAPATAPAAAIELARLLVETNRPDKAQSVLEQLILDYPKSVAMPQARRLLDELKGAVPRT